MIDKPSLILGKTKAEPPPIVEGTGAVALIDALGFRGIWKDHSATELLGALRTAERQASSEAGWRRLFHNQEILTAGFSDTILMAGVPPPADTPGVPAHHSDIETLLEALGGSLSAVMRSLAESDMPLIYRGCVSVGKLAIQEDFFVGQAVDEAAEWFEAADAALVWLTPSAREHISGPTPYFFEWSVPMKGEGAVRTLVVNPLWDLAGEQISSAVEQPNFDDLIGALLEPFKSSTRVDVVRKRQNTAEFLEGAKAHTLERYGPSLESYIADQAADYDHEQALADEAERAAEREEFTNDDD